MKLPDERGRAAILRYYLKPLKLDSQIDVDVLAADFAAATDGASGADLEYLCQTAARLCVKEAVLSGMSPDTVVITLRHAEEALRTAGHGSGLSEPVVAVSLHKGTHQTG